MEQEKMKIISESFLYQHADYGKEIYNFLMTSEPIDKKSDAFSDILYQVKMRQTSPVLSKVLMSNKVVLCIGKKDLARPFRVLRAKDPRDKNAPKKVYIDCTNMILEKDGIYKCNNIPALISYLITAMTYIIYYEHPELITRNSDLTKSATEAFVDLCIYVLGYLKVPVTYADNKEKMSYVLATYYQYCVLGKTEDNSIMNLAKKISKIDTKKAQYLDVLFSSLYEHPRNTNINDFLIQFAQVFMNQSKNYTGDDKLDIDVFVQRWMFLIGPGTFLGLELFVPFSAILTDCYVGAYLNQQNTIEKIVARNVAEFTTTLLKVGSENS